MSDFKEFCRSQPLIYCREISCSLCKRNREATTKLQSKITELEAKLQEAKCCENCKYNDYRSDRCDRDDEECDEKYSGWELRKYRK